MCHASCPNDSKKGPCLHHPVRLQSERCCGRAGTLSLLTSEPRTQPGVCSVSIRSPPPRSHLHRPPETLRSFSLHQSAPPGKPSSIASHACAPGASPRACAPPACGLSPASFSRPFTGRGCLLPVCEGPGVSFPRRPCHSCQGPTEPARPISEEPSTPQGASAQVASDPAAICDGTREPGFKFWSGSF